MEYLKERVSYLKGLAEGLNVEKDSKEGKLLNSIIDVLDDFADTVDDLTQTQDHMNDYVELLDEDLTSLEDNYYEDNYYEDDYDEAQGSMEEYYEIECPNCNDAIIVEEETLMDDSRIACPNCNEEIEITSDEEYEPQEEQVNV